MRPDEREPSWDDTARALEAEGALHSDDPAPTDQGAEGSGGRCPSCGGSWVHISYPCPDPFHHSEEVPDTETTEGLVRVELTREEAEEIANGDNYHDPPMARPLEREDCPQCRAIIKLRSALAGKEKKAMSNWYPEGGKKLALERENENLRVVGVTLRAALDEAKRGLEAIRAQQITSFSYEPDPYTLGRIYGDKLERIFEIMRATLTRLNAIERGEANAIGEGRE